MTPQELARALGDRVKQEGAETLGLCPAHPDHNPSLSITEKNGKLLVICRAGCDQDAVLAELKRRNLWPNGGNGHAGSWSRRGVTLAEYAAAKGLPVDFLQTMFGLRDVKFRDGRTWVEMRYLGAPGEDTYVVKYRVSLNGEPGDPEKKKTRWKKGSKARLYGLWHLPEIKQRGGVVLCEGESDCQSLWHHDFPALSLPGAGSWNEERDAPYLDGIDKIYVIVEPDNGGVATLRWLAASSIRERARVVRMPAETKDPSALHLLDPEGFAEAFGKLLDGAEPPPPAAEPQPGFASTIEVINETFAVVRVANRVVILNEHLDAEGLPTFSLLSSDNSKLLLANRAIKIDGADGPEQLPVAPLWIKSPKRRQYDGITFAPQGSPLGYYNLWRGLPIKPSETGSCERFKEHLRDNVCDGRTDWYNWVFGWFADIFQNPTRKCGTSLALRGGMGVGKTIVGEHFGELLGLHYCPVADPRYITGRFNAHLVRCLLLHADEAFWAGDHAAEGRIKDLITGKRQPIEFKGVESIWVPNYVRLFVTGNPDWIVPTGMDERRFCLLNVADHKKEDTAYFKTIDDELRAGGYARLLWELLDFDLSSVDLRHIPKTEALLDQKIASLSPEHAWWLDILRKGRLPHNVKGATPGKCPGQMLYDDYIEHAQKTGARRRQIETAIGMFLDKMHPGISKNVETFVVADAEYSPIAGVREPPVMNRGTVYSFPKLSECRAEFDKKLHQPIAWPNGDDWTVQQT